MTHPLREAIALMRASYGLSGRWTESDINNIYNKAEKVLARLVRAGSIISKQRGALHFFHEDGIYDVNATEQHNNVRADVLRNALALKLDEELE